MSILKNKVITKIALTALLLAPALTPALIYAAGFQINETSPRLQGQAMAGSGSDTDDVTAIFNNPALLTTIKHAQMYTGVSVIAPHITMSNASATHDFNDGFVPAIPFSPVAITGSAYQGNIANTAVAPNFYIASAPTHHLSFGLSVNAPWGLSSHYDQNSVVRYMAQTTAFQAIDITPMIAYQMNDQLSFGVGIQEQYAKAEFSNFDGDSTDPLNIPTGPTDVSGDGWATGYTLGLLFSPNKNTHIGLSYRSQINYTLKGSGDQLTAFDPFIPDQFDPRCSDPAFQFDTPVNCHTSVTAEMNTPAVLNLSISQAISDKWTVSTTEEITYWSSVSQINVEMPQAVVSQTQMSMNWKDSMLYSIGTQYIANKHWQFRAGAAFDQTPTNDTDRDVRIPDSNRYWLTTGTTYQVTDALRLDLSYEHIFMQGQQVNVVQQTGTLRPVPSQSLPPTYPMEYNNVHANFSGSADIYAIGLNWLL